MEAPPKKITIIIAGTEDSPHNEYSISVPEGNGVYINFLEDLIKIEKYVHDNPEDWGEVYDCLIGMKSLTKEEVLESIRECAKIPTSEINICFTGHGVINRGNWGMKTDSVSLHDIIKTVRSVQRHHLWINMWISACFSGNWARDLEKYKHTDRSITINASCHPDQLSYAHFYTQWLTQEKENHELPLLNRCKGIIDDEGEYGMEYYENRSLIGMNEYQQDSREESKCTVFGYIHRYEVDGSVHVPEVIKNMCVDFYWLEEKFAETRTPVLKLGEDGRLVINCGPPDIHVDFAYRGPEQKATGSVWIDADSQGIAKCQWKIQIAGGDPLGNVPLPLLVIGISDGQNIVHKIEIRDGALRRSMTDKWGKNVESEWERHKFHSYDEITMVLDVENHTLNFNVRRPQYTMGTSPGRETELWSCEMRDLPKAKYRLFAVLKYRHMLRLKDFSIQHRSRSDIPVIPRDVIPVIPRDVHFSCTHRIIVILLVVLWIAVDYQLNRHFHQMGYLQPKIIFTSVFAFVLGIRYGVSC